MNVWNLLKNYFIKKRRKLSHQRLKQNLIVNNSISACEYYGKVYASAFKDPSKKWRVNDFREIKTPFN